MSLAQVSAAAMTMTTVPIPTFEVQAAASYVQKNRSWGVAASWSNPSGVEITQTNTWIEGLKDSTKQSWSGPLNNWWAEDLAPGREYTIVVEVIGKTVSTAR